MAPHPASDALDWRDAACAAALAVAVFAGGWLRALPGVVGGFHDDAVYAITAEALADGEGYRLRNLPGHPPQTKYPVLFPAALALASSQAPDPTARLVAMQRTTTVFAAVAIALAYLVCVQLGVVARISAVAGALLAVSAPNFLYYCAQPLSELPFLALLAIALLAADRRLRATESSAAGELATGLVLGLPFLCRSAGIVVLPAIAIAFLAAGEQLPIRRSRRSLAPLAWMAAGMTAVALPWVIWSLQAAAGTDAVTAYQTDYIGWWRSNASIRVVASNLFQASAATATIPLEALARWLYATTSQAPVVLSALGAAAWLAVLRRSASASLLPVTLVAYLGLVCLWPWPPDRFLVPVLPLVASMFFEDLRLVVVRIGGARLAAGAVAIVAVIACASNLRMLERYLAASDADGYPHFALTGESIPWSSYDAAFRYLREHSAEGDVLAAGFDTMTALYTGRPTIRPFAVRPLSLYYGFEGPPIGTADEMAGILASYGVRYFLATPMPAYAEEAPFYDLVDAVTKEHPSLLRPVWQAPGDPRFVVFEVAKGRGAS